MATTEEITTTKNAFDFAHNYLSIFLTELYMF